LPSQLLHQRLLHPPTMLRLKLRSTRRQIKRINRHLPLSVNQSNLNIALLIRQARRNSVQQPRRSCVITCTIVLVDEHESSNSNFVSTFTFAIVPFSARCRSRSIFSRSAWPRSTSVTLRLNRSHSERFNSSVRNRSVK